MHDGAPADPPSPTIPAEIPVRVRFTAIGSVTRAELEGPEGQNLARVAVDGKRPDALRALLPTIEPALRAYLAECEQEIAF